jgi:hypothetical protein
MLPYLRHQLRRQLHLFCPSTATTPTRIPTAAAAAAATSTIKIIRNEWISGGERGYVLYETCAHCMMFVTMLLIILVVVIIIINIIFISDNMI